MDITSGDDASGELDEGGEGGDAACVRDLPSCPDGGVPSYRNEVSAIVQAKCSTCHYPGNSSAPIALTTYAGLYGSRGADLDQVYACLMPTAAAPALTLTERTDLLTWFVCEAPDN